MFTTRLRQFEDCNYYPKALAVRGRVGKLCIFRYYQKGQKIEPNRYRPVNLIYNYYYPYNPKSEAQQAQRAKYRNAFTEWQSFDDATKQFYNQKAKYKPYSGYNLFMRCSLLS